MLCKGESPSRVSLRLQIEGISYCSPFLPMFLRCLMLMLSGPVELLFLLFLIAARTCSVVMFICVGFRLRTFLVIFLFVVLVL